MSDSAKLPKHKLSNADYDYLADLAPLLSWKVFATGLSFALFGLGGLILSLTVFPLIYLLPIARTRRQRYSRRLLSRLFRLYINVMELLGLIKLDIRGREHLHTEGQLVIANHPSLLDVVYLISLIENTTCVVKNSMWINPFTAGTVLATGYIRNDSDQLITDCANTLAAGNSLIIFPEGTRSDPDKPFKFLRGAANIALLARKDISPVTIHCDPPRLLKNQPWYQASKRTIHVTIECFPARSIATYLDSGYIRSKLARQITKEMQAFYQQH